MNKTEQIAGSKTERIIGFVALLVVLILGAAFLQQAMLFRLAIGLALGYTLMRAYTGFAGSVNRACRAGSTQLMRAMALMFFVTAGRFCRCADEFRSYRLWAVDLTPSTLACFWAAFCSALACRYRPAVATGVLTDLVIGLPRAFITLVFFGVGVYLGFPIQNTRVVGQKILGNQCDGR